MAFASFLVERIRRLKAVGLDFRDHNFPNLRLVFGNQRMIFRRQRRDE